MADWASEKPGPLTTARAGPDTVAVLHIYIDIDDPLDRARRYGEETLSPTAEPRDMQDAPYRASRRRSRGEELTAIVKSSGGLIEAELRASAVEHLGPEFSVSISEVRRGSLEIIALIGLVEAAIAGYGAFRSGLDYVRKDAQALLAKMLQPLTAEGPVTVVAYHELGPGISKLLAPEGRPTPTWSAPSAYLTLSVAFVIVLLLSTLLVVLLVHVI